MCPLVFFSGIPPPNRSILVKSGIATQKFSALPWGSFMLGGASYFVGERHILLEESNPPGVLFILGILAPSRIFIFGGVLMSMCVWTWMDGTASVMVWHSSPRGSGRRPLPPMAAPLLLDPALPSPPDAGPRGPACPALLCAAALGSALLATCVATPFAVSTHGFAWPAAQAPLPPKQIPLCLVACMPQFP